MENKNFDDIIKNRLKELENLSPMSDWDLFHSKYKDQLADTSKLFDKRVQKKIDSLQVPYNNKHWYLMKEALEREEFIRTSIYFSKIVEAGCIFLILFTFLNLFPAISNSFNPIDDSSKRQLIAEAHPKKSTDVTSTEKIIRQVQSSNASTNPLQNLSLSNINRGGSIGQNTTIVQLENQYTEVENNKFQVSELDGKHNVIESPIKERINDIVHSNPYESKEQQSGNQMATSIENRSLLDMVSPLAINQINPLEIKRSFYRIFIPAHLKQNRNQERYISLAFAPTVNIVNSPFDYINKTEPYSTDALGGEIGFNYSVRKNNLEMETGLNYGRKSYEPKQIDEVLGSFFTQFRTLRLKQITYDVMSIPLNLKYHFKNGNDWSLYTLSGISINGIANSDYLLEENGRKISIYDVQTNYRESNTAKKNYSPGILEGGNILDNLFFTLDVAIGIEKEFNASTSFYLAPTLRQHIGLVGVGPNNDKVNSLGFNLGIKKKL